MRIRDAEYFWPWIRDPGGKIRIPDKHSESATQIPYLELWLNCKIIFFIVFQDPDNLSIKQVLPRKGLPGLHETEFWLAGCWLSLRHKPDQPIGQRIVFLDQLVVGWPHTTPASTSRKTTKRELCLDVNFLFASLTILADRNVYPTPPGNRNHKVQIRRVRTGTEPVFVNRFIGSDSCAPYTFTNTGSV